MLYLLLVKVAILFGRNYNKGYIKNECEEAGGIDLIVIYPQHSVICTQHSQWLVVG